MYKFLNFGMSLANIVCEGFVLSKLWSWFIFGTFTNIELTLNHAIGICTIIGLLQINMSHLYQIKNVVDKELFDYVVKHNVLMWFCLLIGYLVK